MAITNASGYEGVKYHAVIFMFFDFYYVVATCTLIDYECLALREQ